MKKTYWWRTLVLVVASLGLIVGYVVFYPYNFGLCNISAGQCFLGMFKKSFAEPLFIISISFLAISPVLFFIRDEIFLRWLKFAVAWFALAAVFIFLAPEYSSGVVGNPTKEIISIWMASLFVITSLIFIVYKSFKLRRK